MKKLLTGFIVIISENNSGISLQIPTNYKQLMNFRHGDLSGQSVRNMKWMGLDPSCV